MENKPIEEMNTDELSVELDNKDKAIMAQMELLETVQVEKHNCELTLMNLSESIRMCKKLISKLRLQKEIIDRAFWRSKGR